MGRFAELLPGQEKKLYMGLLWITLPTGKEWDGKITIIVVQGLFLLLVFYITPLKTWLCGSRLTAQSASPFPVPFLSRWVILD